jgi:hypothetical protein
LTKFINFKDWINLNATDYVCDLVISIDFIMLGPFEIKWVAIACLMLMQPLTQQQHNPHIRTVINDVPQTLNYLLATL